MTVWDWLVVASMRSKLTSRGLLQGLLRRPRTALLASLATMAPSVTSASLATPHLAGVKEATPPKLVSGDSMPKVVVMAVLAPGEESPSHSPALPVLNLSTSVVSGLSRQAEPFGSKVACALSPAAKSDTKARRAANRAPAKMRWREGPRAVVIMGLSPKYMDFFQLLALSAIIMRVYWTVKQMSPEPSISVQVSGLEPSPAQLEQRHPSDGDERSGCGADCDPGHHAHR